LPEQKNLQFINIPIELRFHRNKIMKIAIAADHAGYDEKENLKVTLEEIGIEYEDMGPYSGDSVDYPDYARKVAEAVAHGDFEQGILVCGSGTGMAISANKVKGIRAAVAWNEETASLARRHNNANVLAVGARTSPTGTIPDIVKAWFAADFEGGRHAGRVDKITQIEKDDLC
jgi:ribose 5-phosphate isomerase B